MGIPSGQGFRDTFPPTIKNMAWKKLSRPTSNSIPRIDFRITQAGDFRITQAGDFRIISRFVPLWNKLVKSVGKI